VAKPPDAAGPENTKTTGRRWLVGRVVAVTIAVGAALFLKELTDIGTMTAVATAVLAALTWMYVVETRRIVEEAKVSAVAARASAEAANRAASIAGRTSIAARMPLVVPELGSAGRDGGLDHASLVVRNVGDLPAYYVDGRFLFFNDPSVAPALSPHKSIHGKFDAGKSDVLKFTLTDLGFDPTKIEPHERGGKSVTLRIEFTGPTGHRFRVDPHVETSRGPELVVLVRARETWLPLMGVEDLISLPDGGAEGPADGDG